MCRCLFLSQLSSLVYYCIVYPNKPKINSVKLVVVVVVVVLLLTLVRKDYRKWQF